MAVDSTYRFTVGICTRNRPEDLARTLRSIQASTHPVHQVLVSDDSPGNETEDLIRAQFSGVQYTRGPRLGLGPNRNHCLALCTGTHIFLADDDLGVCPEFFARAAAVYDALPEGTEASTIVSGVERTHGVIVYPSDFNFLGFMSKSRPLDSDDPLHTMVINAAVFPRAVFARIGFDENLVYGYDEADISTRAVACGFRIVLLPDLVNDHYSSNIGRAQNVYYLHASRLYATFKRYLFVERKWMKALAFALYANTHLLAHLVKTNGVRGVRTAFDATLLATKYVLRHTMRRRDRPPLREDRTAACPLPNRTVGEVCR
jgi:GT2 family glycosyltransferase